MRVLVQVLKNIWNAFEIFSTVIERFLRVIAFILLLAMCAMLLLNAASRWGWAPDSMMGWPLGLVPYMIVWSVFVMVGPVARLDGHIRVNFITAKLLGEKRAKIFMDIMEDFAGMSWAIFMALPAYRWVLDTYRLGLEEQSYGGWSYPLWVVRLGMFIGLICLAFFYFERTLKWIINLASGLASGNGSVGELESGAALSLDVSDGQFSPASKQGSALEDRQ